jgi:hypothetical protein
MKIRTAGAGFSGKRDKNRPDPTLSARLLRDLPCGRRLVDRCVTYLQ